MVHTPSTNSRLNLMNGSNHLGLRLTPSNSPHTPGRSSPLRSPVKASARNELGIALKQVIGATAGSKNAFDTNGSCFAFTAGAAAVIATFDAELQNVQQSFYRARPTALPINPIPVIYDSGTPTASDTRSRTAAYLRNAGVGTSPIGQSAADWGENSAGKTWSAKERVKAATCVSFSPNGKFLAVGETGYKPRVLVFSTTQDASTDIPLTSLTDHAFGVRCVAFSPDSQYLASLGASNDGFLYIWRINERNGAATLFASNKCTSDITQITWMGTKLVTIGKRHVKMWRVADSAPSTPSRQSDSAQAMSTHDHRTLLGRNCVLGDFLEATFTTIVPLDSDRAIICSDKGTVCLLTDRDGQQRFTKLNDVPFSVTGAILAAESQLLLAGDSGELFTMSIGNLEDGQTSWRSPSKLLEPFPMTAVAAPKQTPSLVAFSPLRDLIGTLDTRGVIRFMKFSNVNSLRPSWRCIYKLPAHGGPVLGVRAVEENNDIGATFFTWTGDGTVLFWDSDGGCKKSVMVHIEQLSQEEGVPNELRVVRYMASKACIATGDKYGILRIHDLTIAKDVFSTRAHAAEITDLAIYDGDTRYVATCGRDRTLQVFHELNNTWELLHTLDEHVGAVNAVLFSKDGEKLISCSSDRTVVVRERASKEIDGQLMSAFIIARTITTKATPQAMVFDPFQESVIHLSTIDRFMHKYDIQSGRSISSFKTGDADGGDAVVMSSLVAMPTLMGGSIIAGLSSTDKSIRFYEETGTMLARDWGHTEGVTDIAVLGREANDANGTSHTAFVTVALDGTIFSWRADLSARKRGTASDAIDSGAATPTGISAQQSLISRPPLRRVLSSSEIARFQGTSDLDETPTRLLGQGQRSPPRIRKRASRSSLLHVPKLEPSTASRPDHDRRAFSRRSPSPPSPRSRAPDSRGRRESLDPTSRHISLSKTKSTGNLRESIVPSHSSPPLPSLSSHSIISRDTDAVNRALRIFRRKLNASTEMLSADMVRELERELSSTMRALGEKVMQSRRRQRRKDVGAGANSTGVDEEMLSKMLDQYSERLVSLLDVRLAGLKFGEGPEKGKGREMQALAGAEADLNGRLEVHRTDGWVESIEEVDEEKKK